MHKIELKTKNPNAVSTGANTELYIDGQKAKGIKSFKYEVNSTGVGIVTVEYYGNIEINSNLPSIIADEILTNEPTVSEFGTFKKIWRKDDDK